MIGLMQISDSDLTIGTLIATFSMIPIIAFPAINDRLRKYLILVIFPTNETHIISNKFLNFILFINQVIDRL